jgi:gas vesicle protein
MSKKNLFILAAWYIAWGVIASLYNKKKPEQIKKDIEKAKEKWESSFKVVYDNFVQTHSNLFEDVKKEVLSEKNKALFNEHKEELIKILDSYKEKSSVLIEELKIKWKDYFLVTSEKLEKLYNEKLEEIESLKWVAPEKMSDLKEKLLESFEELKNEIKKLKK